MLKNYSQGLYDDALRVAEEILDVDPQNAESWNVKGDIHFYRGDYKSAIEFFTNAVNNDQSSTICKSNLSYAYIERGFYKKAIELLHSIEDGREDWDFSVGRTYLYDDKFGDARKHLQGVSTSYWHGQLGY